MTETSDASEDRERIAKRIARAGVASRREAERMIAEGRVRLNGQKLKTPAVTVGQEDQVEVDGKPLSAPEPARMWRYHKPPGLVTTEADEHGRPTIFERLPRRMPRVLSVGRLDMNSEGLLLLTNDGGLKRSLELPSTGWKRVYRARAYGTVQEELLDDLRRGINVEGERFRPMEVEVEQATGRNVWLQLTLTEGKNREVRRALESIGLTVNRLIRIAYGPFALSELSRGAVQEVPGFEMRRALRSFAELPRTRDAHRRR